MKETLDQIKYGIAEADVEDLFLRRWSPRAFADKPVETEVLKAVFAAGIWAASSFNEQPWRFIVGLKGDATWQRIFTTLTPANQSWAVSAPVLFASFAKKTFSHNNAPNRVAIHDVGAASAQISLEATVHNLHTHGMAGFDADELHKIFGIPEDFESVACWALGYQGDPAILNEQQQQMELSPRKRKPLSDIVFAEWESAAF